MKTIAFINQKGGVGKSICAFNIGAILSKVFNKKVLFIDLDPQATLTDFVNPESINGSSYELFTKTKNNYHIISGEAYDIIPGSIELTNLYGKDISANKLKANLEAINGYDYIILDCPPALGIININALMAADTIISIIKPDIVSSRGLSLLTDTLNQVKPGKAIDAVIVNQYKRRKISDLTTELMRQDYNVLNTVIRDSSVIAESASIGKDIVEYANKSIGYDDFLNVTNELIKEKLL